jgi:subtilisin family serine protease
MNTALPRLATVARAALAAACLGLPATARADEPATPTPMAQAIHAEFLLDAPPPPGPVAVCVIDSGVTVNPDTQGALLDRSALDGGTPDDVGDAPGYLPHGTMVSSVIAAPKNGWGTVGIWPQAKIVSVRVFQTPDAHDANAMPYSQAVYACLSHPEVKVINISIAGPAGSQDEFNLLTQRLAWAMSRGVSVVVAAGNTAGPPLFPGSVEGVLPVAASVAETGSLCPFSAAGLRTIAAAGCGAVAGIPLAYANGTPAWAWGTSFAAPAVSAVLAAVRGYRPDLSREQAEQLIRATTTASGGTAGYLNAEAAFRTAGLGNLVPSLPEPPPADPAPPTEAPPPSPNPGGTVVKPPVSRPHRPAQPKVVSMALCRRRLTIRVRPVVAPRRVEVRAGAKRLVGRGPTFRLSISARAQAVTLRTWDGRTHLWSKPLTSLVPIDGCGH